MPKARKPFALFAQERSKLGKGASREDFAAEMRGLGASWKALSDEAKEAYKSKSALEFRQQRNSMRLHGLPVRGISQKPPSCHGSEDKKAVDSIEKLGAYKILQQDGQEHSWQLRGFLWLGSDGCG